MVQSKEMLVIWDSRIFVQTYWLFGVYTFITESKPSLKSTKKDNRNLRRTPVTLSIGTDRYHQNARVLTTCSSVEWQNGIVTNSLNTMKLNFATTPIDVTHVCQKNCCFPTTKELTERYL
jgi:hypothetical protein